MIAAQPDMGVVGEAGNGRAAVERAPALQPDVVLLDISMPDVNGLEATRALLAAVPTLAVVALTRYNDPAYVKEMLAAGALGYVLKQSRSSEMLAAIRAVAQGRRYLDPALGYFEDTPLHPRKVAGATISERETDVLRRMARGFSNKEIANELNISVKTVEVHKANAMRKLGLRGRIDLVRYAVLLGWMDDA